MQDEEYGYEGGGRAYGNRSYRERDDALLYDGPGYLTTAAYTLIRNFLDNTDANSAMAHFVLEKVSAEYNSPFPELSKIVPVKVAEMRSRLEKVRSRRSELYDAIEPAEEAIYKLTERREDIEEKIEETSSDKIRAELEEELARLEEQTREERRSQAEAKDALIAAEKEEDNLSKRVRQGEYDVAGRQKFLAGNADYIEAFQQDWALMQEWIAGKITQDQPSETDPYARKLDLLAKKLNLTEDQQRVLLFVLCMNEVGFFKSFINSIAVRNRDAVSAIAKMCGASLEEVGKIFRGASRLNESGLIVTDDEDDEEKKKAKVNNGYGNSSDNKRAFLMFNKRVSTILSADDIGEDEMFEKLVGTPVRTLLKDQLSWQRDIAPERGLPGQDTFDLLKSWCGKDLTGKAVMFYGEKGTGKTQGAVSVALEAGYAEDGYVAHETNESGAPMSYAERMATIRLSLALLSTNPKALLIVDEIDKFGGDDGAKENVAFLRMIENAPIKMICTANKTEFSEAFKDRFAFALKFNITPASRRVATFMAIAKREGLELGADEADFVRLVRRTKMNNRGMEQAIENAISSGGGLSMIRATFEAKAEFVNGSRSALTSDEPPVDPRMLQFFNGKVDGLPLSPFELISHMKGQRDLGFSMLLSGPHDVEKNAYIEHLATELGLGVVWNTYGSLFGGSRELEAAFNMAEDMGQVLVLLDAGHVVKADDKKKSEDTPRSRMLELLNNRSYPVIFVADRVTEQGYSLPISGDITFVVDCLPMTHKQAEQAFATYMGVAPPPLMHQIVRPTVDIFQRAARKLKFIRAAAGEEGAVDPNFAFTLVKAEHDRKEETAAARFLPVISNLASDTPDPDRLVLGSLGQRRDSRSTALSPRAV
jgi:hypothetical protein